jgi:SAM-dependent methyltransferase
MPNRFILRSVNEAWSRESGRGKRILDLSCGGGATARALASQGFSVVATDYTPPPPMEDSIRRVGGVDLNEPLPFRICSFDGVNLTEVIEHIEHQAQLIREIGRVLKAGGVVVISTPNVLNVFSRLRFLFTGFLRGRVRPANYTSTPVQAPNIYLIHFYELYYLLFHYGFEIEELRQTRVKFAPVFFTIFLYPCMWLFSLVAVIGAEKDPVQRRYNWQILRYLFHRALLFSDNVVVKARKTASREDRSGP